MGGLWERSIQSLKYHLRRTVGSNILTFEELLTLLTQIEAILNSRPITPVSNDATDLSCLTPGHFLVGAPLTSLPEPILQGLPESKMCRWQRIQRLQQNFWDRWSKDYLHTLQQRTKWNKVSPNIQKGTLVLLKEDNTPPTSWCLGRIKEVFPGSDKLVRVVQVKTARGLIKRPIHKVVPLIDFQEDSI